MMILCSLKPFTFAQKIMVFDNEGNLETTVSASVKDLPETLCEIANKYQCNKIKMSGSKIYTKGFEEKIKGCYLAKYNKNDIEIEYI